MPTFRVKFRIVGTVNVEAEDEEVAAMRVDTMDFDELIMLGSVYELEIDGTEEVGA